MRGCRRQLWTAPASGKADRGASLEDDEENPTYMMKGDRLLKKRERFVGEEISVTLPDRPHPRRDPPAPTSFCWRQREIQVRDIISEWWDYSHVPRGHRATRQAHREKASRRGSYGVGRHHFLILTDLGRCEIYYDRRPTSPGGAGSWVLFRMSEPCPDDPTETA